MKLDELVTYLDVTLDIGAFDDSSVNGLQVEAGAEVDNLAIAVDASLEAIEGAAEAGAQMLLVHHGLLWGKPSPLRGVLGARVGRLFRTGVSLYAAHIPLDAHPTLGNNAELARRFELREVEPFGVYRGKSIGLAGSLDRPRPVVELIRALESRVGPATAAVLAGENPVARVAVVSGGAGDMVEEAARNGIQLLVTGEQDHTAAVYARDAGIHLLFLGHHATEVYGVRALAGHLESEFGLPWTTVGRGTGI
jgi:dinuclear metal center YbgI/SA1388 family protein